MLLLAFQDMKGFLAAVVLVLAGVTPAFAQGPLMRGDVSASLGWLTADTEDYDYYDDWYKQPPRRAGGGLVLVESRETRNLRRCHQGEVSLRVRRRRAERAAALWTFAAAVQHSSDEHRAALPDG